MDIINTRLLSHPINWLFVWIVAALAAMAYGIVHDRVTQDAADRSIIPD